MTKASISIFQKASLNTTTGKKYGDIGYQTNSPNIQLFSRALEGLNPSTQGYEDLTPLECAEAYNTDFSFQSSRRNVFLITKHSSNTTFNHTILAMHISDPRRGLPDSWLCSYDIDPESEDWCNSDERTTNLTRGLPWRVKLKTVREVEIAGCKSEATDEKCKVQFSLDIMIVVICCNLVKACSMIMAVFRSREPTLVTLGDAVDSFLRVPDPTTMGMCFADRQFIEKEWRRGRGNEPRQWKQKGAQRWWTSPSKTRWIICNFFCSITIIVAGVLLGLGIGQDGQYSDTDIKSMQARPPITISLRVSY